VRVVPRGSANYHAYAREGGVLSELMVGERMRNHEPIFENGWANSVWDLSLYDIAQRTDNLTLLLNTAVRDVVVEDGRIAAVIGWTIAAETETEVRGEVFLDCTGDGVVAALAGCECRIGDEARAELDEPHRPGAAASRPMATTL